MMKKGQKIDFTAEVEALLKLQCKLCKSMLYYAWKCAHSICRLCYKELSMLKQCPECSAEVTEDSCDVDIGENVSKNLQNIESICSLRENFLRGYTIIWCKHLKANAKGEYPLHRACATKNLGLLEKYIAEKHNLNAKDFAGWAPLHEAVQSCFQEGVETLLKAGALANMPGYNYNTPLHLAAEKKQTDICKLLIEYGAMKTVFNSDGKTPVDIWNEISYFDNVKRKILKVLFMDPKICIYHPTCDQQLKDELKNHAEITDKLTKKCTHFIITEKSSKLDFMIAYMMGLFITTADWLTQLKTSESSRIPSENFSSKLPVLTKILGLPPLFDGISFYITDHKKDVTINNCVINKETLEKIIVLGGGSILHRPPSETTASNLCFPYHVEKDSKISHCSHYIIFEENNPPQLQYKMKELQHQSSAWLLKCICDFKISI